MGNNVRCASCGFDNAEEGKPCPSCGTEDPSSGMTLLASTLKIPPPDKQTPPGISTSTPYPIGHLFAGRYKIERFLGQGGMGAVYLVHDLSSNEDQALKILNSNAYGEDGGARFKREIEILARLDHASVPKVYGWGMEGTELYFLCQYIDGHDLKSEIKLNGPWPAAKAAELAARVADVLAFAHLKGIVHRDVKPNNVMIDAGGVIYLLDFGVARATGQGMQTLTQTGMLLGTPEYMSPEQFNSNRVDERSDIYSLGVLLYELVTGQTPFGGQTPVIIALKHIQEAPPPPRNVRADVPAWLERIILKCLEKDRNKRYATAAELATELRKARTEPRKRLMKTGDRIVEDESESTDAALVVSSSREKTGWNQDMGLHFEDRLFKLIRIEEPNERSNRWTYYFSNWPQDEVFRRLIDYERDAAERSEKEDVQESFYGKMKKILKKDIF